jgi:hypothetical protein
MVWDAISFSGNIVLAAEDGALRSYNEEFIL